MNDSRESAARALLDQAMQLHQQGKLEQAANFYAEHLKQTPDDPQALRLYGILARDSGNSERSLALLIKLAQLQPENPVAFEEIALTYMAAGLLDDAAEALKHSLELKPDNLRALSLQGALLQFRGHAHAAVRVYREALNLEPDDIEIRSNMAKALAESGDTESALYECKLAVKASDEHPLAVSVQATILADTGAHEEAAKLFESLREFAGYDESILINLGFSYQQLGNTTAAIDALREAVNTNPHNARAVSDLAYALIAKQEGQLARELCEGFLLRHPGEPLVLAAFAYAAAATNSSLCDELFNYEHLIQTTMIECPAGFQNVAEFNKELLRTIYDDPSLNAEPLNKATTGGSQTGEFEFSVSPALKALKQLIQQVVDTYPQALIAAGLQNHPSLARRTEEFGIRAWGTVIGAGGRQTPHIHPTSWLSGVYYAAVPALDSDEGSIEFGLPPERTGISAEMPANFGSHRTKPEAGLLVVFPSYLYHQTLPFAANQPRVSIAFDAVPFSSMAMF